MSDDSRSPAIELADREAIRDCLYRSALANDMCDLQMWKSTYWPDGYEDHSPMFVGNAHRFVEVIIPMIQEQMQRTWHQIGSTLIRIDGAFASVVSYAHVFARLRETDPTGARNMVGGIRHVDQFERREGEWRILSRVTHADWLCSLEDAPGFEPTGGLETGGARETGDPARLIFEQAGLEQLYRSVSVLA